MKTGMTTGAVVVGLVAVMTALPLAGQRGGGRQGPGARGGADGPAKPGVMVNVEAALLRAEALGLDQSQVEALQALRDDSRALRNRWEEEGLEMRQRMRARDQALRDERRARMTEIRQERREDLAPLQDRYESVLTTEQRQQLRQSMVRGQRGAVQDRRPRALRGGDAVRRGPASPGMRRPWTAEPPAPRWRRFR